MVNIWSSCSSETNPGKTWHRAWVIYQTTQSDFKGALSEMDKKFLRNTNKLKRLRYAKITQQLHWKTGLMESWTQIWDFSLICMEAVGRETHNSKCPQPCLSYGLTENTCFSLPYPAQSPDFVIKNVQKSAYTIFVIRLLIPFTPLSGLLIFIPLTWVAPCTMLVTAWLCL